MNPGTDQPIRVAIVRGPYFRPNSTLLWEYVHNTYQDVDVTGFNSDPAWYNPSVLDMPIKELVWVDGQLDLFGHEQVLWKVLEEYKFPSIALLGLKKIAQEYDVIHVTENFRLYSATAALLCDQYDTKLFVDVHENIPHRPANPVTWFVKRIVNSRATTFTTSTTAGKRALVHEGVAAKDIELLPNVIDTEKFNRGSGDANDVDLPERLEETFNILFVHGLRKQKGVHYLIKAFESFTTDVDNTSLILVGRNRLDPEFYRQAIQSNPKIYHIEHIPNEKISTLYNLSEVFTLPSITVQNNEEQFGFSVLEAMACGLPSVVTDVGGLPFVVEEGVTSLVVEERSSDALKRAFERLYYDDALRAILEEQSYRFLHNTYTAEIVGPDLCQYYRNAFDGYN